MSLDFPSTDESLPQVLQNTGIQWKTPLEIDPDAVFLSNVDIFNRRYQVKKGFSGGFFLVAVAALTNSEQKFKKIVEQQDINAENFHFKFYTSSKVIKTITIDGKLPVDQNGQLVFAQAIENNFWCPLLEKAYAKLLGNYQNLGLGKIEDSIKHLTGLDPSNFRIEDRKGSLYETIEELWKNNAMICCKEKHDDGNNGDYGKSWYIVKITKRDGVIVNDGDEDNDRKIPLDKFKERFDFVIYTKEVIRKIQTDRGIEEFNMPPRRHQNAGPCHAAKRNDGINDIDEQGRLLAHSHPLGPQISGEEYSRRPGQSGGLVGGLMDRDPVFRGAPAMDPFGVDFGRDSHFGHSRFGLDSPFMRRDDDLL